MAKKKQRVKYSNLEKLAYNLGRIQKGLKSETRVKDSFNNGLYGISSKEKKKPLY